MASVWVCESLDAPRDVSPRIIVVPPAHKPALIIGRDNRRLGGLIPHLTNISRQHFSLQTQADGGLRITCHSEAYPVYLMREGYAKTQLAHNITALCAERDQVWLADGRVKFTLYKGLCKVFGAASTNVFDGSGAPQCLCQRFNQHRLEAPVQTLLQLRSLHLLSLIWRMRVSIVVLRAPSDHGDHCAATVPPPPSARVVEMRAREWCVRINNEQTEKTRRQSLFTGWN
jgi:hypothetical protein